MQLHPFHCIHAAPLIGVLVGEKKRKKTKMLGILQAVSVRWLKVDAQDTKMAGPPECQSWGLVHIFASKQ